nr:MAG TPA: hypothetical protein [Caudoviricetes sp.]
MFWVDYCENSKNKKKFFWRLKEYTYICGMKQQRPGVFPAI